MAEVTLPQFPEPRIRPNLSRPTHRVPKLRDVSAVFQFIHSRSFDASGQNPVSRIASWGPQGAPSFQRGQIPDSKFQVLSVDQGPEYRFSSEPSGRGGWTRIQIPSSRGGLSHISKSEKTQVEKFPQGGSRIQREGNERAKYKIHMIAVSRWRVGNTITLCVVAFVLLKMSWHVLGVRMQRVCVLRVYGDGGREQGTRAGTRRRRNSATRCHVLSQHIMPARTGARL